MPARSVCLLDSVKRLTRTTARASFFFLSLHRTSTVLALTIKELYPHDCLSTSFP